MHGGKEMELEDGRSCERENESIPVFMLSSVISITLWAKKTPICYKLVIVSSARGYHQPFLPQLQQENRCSLTLYIT